MRKHQTLVIILVVLTTIAIGCKPSEQTMTPTQPPKPTLSPVPTSTSTPEPLPTSTSTPEPLPTAVATEPFGAWWSSQMTQDEEGHWWPPEEVQEMVGEHHIQAFEEETAPLRLTPPDYDAFEEALRTWETGPMLKDSLTFLTAYRDHTTTIRYTDWKEYTISTRDWSENGLECTIDFAGLDGVLSERHPETGDLLGTQQYGVKMGIRVRYDPAIGHWQLYQMIEFVPLR